jgi:hypothetical protein
LSIGASTTRPVRFVIFCWPAALITFGPGSGLAFGLFRRMLADLPSVIDFSGAVAGSVAVNPRRSSPSGQATAWLPTADRSQGVISQVSLPM